MGGEGEGRIDPAGSLDFPRFGPLGFCFAPEAKAEL